jgi:hypothetical protein
MERMVHLYAAPSEYMALSVQAALSGWGVTCLLFCNEIPMKPGYIFGADWAYADLYIMAEDQAIGRAVLADTLEIMCAEDHGAQPDYPPRISVRGHEWLGLVLCVSWSLMFAPIPLFGWSLLQSYFFPMRDTDQSVLLAAVVMLAFYICLRLAFFGGLFYLNWERAKRILQALGPALLGALALPLWLLFELVRWGWNKLMHPAPLDS